jgi:hypothetical protein
VRNPEIHALSLDKPAACVAWRIAPAVAAALLAACATTGPGTDPAAAPTPAGDANREIAAAAPQTDIYAVDVTTGADGAPRFGTPRNLTGRPGYDNQPAFEDSGVAFYFTSIRDGGQADLFRFDLRNGRTRRLTRTDTSEYSPTPMPTGGISTVRVEAGGAQRLWHLSARGASRGPLLESDRVGYHAWIDDTRLAVFLVTEPPTLVVAPRLDVPPPDGPGQVAETVATGVGRSLARVPGRPWIAFVQRRADAPDWIKVVQLPGLRVVAWAPMPEGARDFAFAPDGSLYTARDRTLLRREAEAGAEWEAVATFERLPDAVSRLAISPDGTLLLLVAGDGGGPAR